MSQNHQLMTPSPSSICAKCGKSYDEHIMEGASLGPRCKVGGTWPQWFTPSEPAGDTEPTGPMPEDECKTCGKPYKDHAHCNFEQGSVGFSPNACPHLYTEDGKPITWLPYWRFEPSASPAQEPDSLAEAIQYQLDHRDVESCVHLHPQVAADLLREVATLREEKTQPTEGTKEWIIKRQQDEINELREQATLWNKQNADLQAQVERLKEENKQFALDFFSYMDNERWKYDHREQKTHSIAEHFEYFKMNYEKP